MIRSTPTVHKNAGFTLVEVLVAVTILLFIITGPMTIAVQSNRSTEFAIEQATAFFLAQEGLELAQNARDSYQLPELYNNLGGDPWQDFIDEYVTGMCESGCYLEIENNSADPEVEHGLCTGNSCRLYIDANDTVRSRYTVFESGGDTQTPYTREITMEEVDESVRVSSRVSWRPSNQITEREVVVDTYLFDIYGN